MLRKLRLKFIALNMTLVALVLLTSFGTITYLNYRANVAEVHDALLETIAHAQAPAFGFDDLAGGKDKDAAKEPTDGAPPQIGGRPDGNRMLIPVAVYFAADGENFKPLPAYTTASISDDVLESALEDVALSSSNSGFLKAQGLYFMRMDTDAGVYLAYADASAASSWQRLAGTLALVGCAALAVFLLISIFFSRWALRPVERAWAQQQQFVADASHELKTPLTVILANTAILRSHPNDTVAQQAQWIESTQTEAKRMQGLVNDMLDLARPEDAAHSQLELAPVDLSDMVEGDVLQFESVAFERGIALESELAPEVFVHGDVRRLQRLTSTLIDNACKYCADGGHVSVTLQEGPREARLIVRNDGAAISPEDLPHVFDRFYRADKARSGSTGGYGLGLAIAREVAREHGGEIAVSSTPQDGTSFTVTLPLLH